MASVRYYLRTKSARSTSLIGSLSYDGNEFRFDTVYMVSPKNWDQKKQRVSNKERDYETINSYLVRKSAEILQLHDDLKREERLNNANLASALSGNLKKTTTKKTLYEHIEDMIRYRQDEKIINKKGFDATLGKYKTVYEKVKDFANRKYGRDVDFEDIDLEFYKNFVSDLKEQNYVPNTIAVFVKKLKRFLNVATTIGINQNLIYKSTEFKAPSETKKHIYLDEEEILKLYNLELSGEFEMARDLFVIGCRTGLRVSDYRRCVDGAVENTGLICVDNTDKTGEPVYVPLHWQVKEMLNKYSGMPKLIGEVLINRYMKKIGEMAKIDNLVTDTRRGRNRPKDASEFCEKYKLITTHTARRSCATNMYLAGFDLYFIQGVLGHTKITTTINYLGITRKVMAMKMLDHEYFKKPQENP